MNSWTSKRDVPTGKLCLQAYSPYMGTEWKKKWFEAKAGDLARRFSEIIKELEDEAAGIAKLVKDAKHAAELEHQRWEEMQRKWKQEEAERRRVQTIKESREELAQIINDWDEQKRIEEFFNDIQRRGNELGHELREAISDKLNRARALLSKADAIDRFRMWKAPEER